MWKVEGREVAKHRPAALCCAWRAIINLRSSALAKRPAKIIAANLAENFPAWGNFEFILHTFFYLKCLETIKRKVQYIMREMQAEFSKFFHNMQLIWSLFFFLSLSSIADLMPNCELQLVLL